MTTLEIHVLPEDLDGGAVGDTAWFGRYSPFIQAETRRQVEYRRRTWPDLPVGEHSKRAGSFYPHLLPADRWKLNLFEPIRERVVPYLDENDIALHSEAANLRSSQVCCFNFLFPLRLDLEAAAVVLAPVLRGVAAVDSIEFEDAGEEGATEWLGEPTGGRRGANRTSIDAAVRWRDLDGQRRLTLVEWKYTEEKYGTCGGFASKGNLTPERCTSFDPRRDPSSQCYLAAGGRHGKRRYWEHLRPDVLGRLSGTKGCPFQGPLYQLLRQELLAEHFRSTGRYDEVDVVVLHFGGNAALAEVPVHLRPLGSSVGAIWSTAVGVGFREVAVERVMEAIDAAPVERLTTWRRYTAERYGV